MSTDKLPDGWTRVKFGDVVRKVNDRVDPDTAGIERYVAGEHMDTDDLTIRRWGEVGDGYLGPAFHMRFKPGQVLYGSRRTYLRKVAVADFEGITANTTFVLEPSSKDLLPEFLPIVMTTEAFHEHSIKQSKGSVNPYINFSDLTWYEFALPTLDEQRRMLQLLRGADVALENWRNVGSAASALLDAKVRQLSLTAGGAESVLITEVADLQPGRQLSPEHRRSIRPVPYLRAANLKLDRVDLEDIKTMDFTVEDEARFRVREGDILLVEGGDPDKVGAPSFVDFEPAQPLCIQNTVIRVRPQRERYDARFLYWCLRARFAGGDFERLATGTKLYHLGVRKVEGLRVPLMTKERQQVIATELDRVQSLVVSVRKQVESGARLRSGLIESLLIGALS